MPQIGVRCDRSDGAFQQWQRLHDPVYACQQFYAKLLTVPNWQSMALTGAAQAMQRSATPDAFGKWEPDVNKVGTGTFWNSSDDTADTGGFACDEDGGDGQANGGAALSADYTLPPNTPPAVVTAIFWTLAQLETPYHFGGDCTAAHFDNSAEQCDCSSLLQQAFRAANISIPRTTSEQIYAGATSLDVSQTQPGDLLFIPGRNGTPAAPATSASTSATARPAQGSRAALGRMRLAPPSSPESGSV